MLLITGLCWTTSLYLISPEVCVGINVGGWQEDTGLLFLLFLFGDIHQHYRSYMLMSNVYFPVFFGPYSEHMS